ncbi:hypothetical protein UlMin_044565 [Ulmus minor]
MATPRRSSSSSSSKSNQSDKSSQKSNKNDDNYWSLFHKSNRSTKSSTRSFRNYDNSTTGFQTAPTSPPSTAGFSAQTRSASSEISFPPSPSNVDFSHRLSLLEPSEVSLPFSPDLHRRDALPSHYLLKIESFSLLSKASIEKYSGSEFEVGGYKWKLAIYPNGIQSLDGPGHISIYLELVDTRSLSTGWEINTIVNFFLFDRVRDKYVSLQDAAVRRFHCMKTQWGIAKFIDLETFYDPSNGYLVNDSCTFGVEVFIVKSTFTAERLSMIRSPMSCNYSWKFDFFSKRTQDLYESDLFAGGDYKWTILFWPNGIRKDAETWGNYISLGLNLNTSSFPPGKKLLVHYIFRVRDQKKNNHYEQSERGLISSTATGFRQFMSLNKFKDPENGFLVRDACIIDAQFEVLGLVTLD